MRCGLVSGHAWSEHAAEQEKSPKNRHRNTRRFTFAGRVQSKLHDTACFWDASRGYVYDRTPLSAVCGCRRPKASLWHAFWTGHTCSCHENGTFRPKRTTNVSRASWPVDVFGSCAANTTQNALKSRYLQRVCVWPHGIGLGSGNRRCSSSFWHDWARLGGDPPPIPTAKLSPDRCWKIGLFSNSPAGFLGNIRAVGICHFQQRKNPKLFFGLGQ